MTTVPEKSARLPARFHFDARLDLFLAREHRGQHFAWGCPPQASLKHMIEALGVPHTEVGMVLVNGEPTALNRPVCAGDSIEVLPALPALADLALRFAADSHLGGLARLLRMAGFDTLFDNAWPDHELARLSAQEGRIVLTRDRDLLKRRDILQGCHVLTLQPEHQWRELAARYPLPGQARPFSRCLPCNVELEPPSREQLQASVPPAVLARHQRFMRCPACRRVYWEGTHWRRMRRLVGDLLPRDAENGFSNA
jgi:uncharacterized protein with PIN domain